MRTEIKIAYIGGGSRGWAWTLMGDLFACESLGGEIALYDIDLEAAKQNEIIGNRHGEGAWHFRAVPSLKEALSGADFVIISILPGTFQEMESDVHAPEKYGIYQSVGDTTGPGGVLRALRTVPMMEEIAQNIQAFAPDAWVINYTNPMAACVRTLYRTFPQIKAFGCCHEVFGIQKLLAQTVERKMGVLPKRQEIHTNVVGVNHFTWLTSARYGKTDLLPLYREFCEEFKESGSPFGGDDNWMNNSFVSRERVKMDLFLRFGYIAAAGDRHLAEFCPGDWYLKDLETVAGWKFSLTPVSWRKEDLKSRMEKSRRMVAGEIPFDRTPSEEEGVAQICALVGQNRLVTNVNLPNMGQIPNLPPGAVVETNASFGADRVDPVFAGEIPSEIFPMVERVCLETEQVVQAGIERNLEMAFSAFCQDPLVRLPREKARTLFDEMVKNTQKYLKMYG